ncbi:MAG: UDP-glucose--hexose-1-phosphate uridylyltransferase [bacterium]|nr:UDP-glucose--hexose-1-phosphate uridylyltransferase [bacterium]
MIEQKLKNLIGYAIKESLLSIENIEYATNSLLYLFKLDQMPEMSSQEVEIYSLLEEILNYAVERGLIEQNIETYRDHFEAKMMDCFLPRPSELNMLFRERKKIGPKTATDFFYHLSKATNYIKVKRNAKNIEYVYNGKYAPLQITINLSKPEKDPKLIALLGKTTQKNYPKCALCMENVGFYGTLDKASRSNHRVVDLTINHQKNAWGLQYSPYAYFNEHCIILKKEHTPMSVDSSTFEELVDFINQFPHYMIGSNAGLPIVGGSILNHYHFQGGRHHFPIEQAKVLRSWKKKGVEVEVIDWPMSTIVVTSDHENKLLDMVNDIFDAWKKYNNPAIQLFSHTIEDHNTVTPILRLEGSKYKMILVLRNNFAPESRPYGLYHPREQYFNIKKENIGLIEVMGLAVLPGRLKTELDLIRSCLEQHMPLSTYSELLKHQEWVSTFENDLPETENLDSYLKEQVGKVFEKVLEDCAVFSIDQREAFFSFVESAIY